MKSSKWHYTDKLGKQQGPISSRELKKLCTDSTISKNSMVWKEGMPNWHPISEVEVLKKKIEEEPKNLYTKKDRESKYDHSTHTSTNVNMDEYKGIGRIFYLIGIIIILVLPAATAYFIWGKDIIALTESDASALQEKFSAPDTNTLILAAISVALILALYLWLHAARLKSTGMSRLASILAFVPLINIYIHLRCIAYPKKYSKTKTLDFPGKLIVFIFFLSIIIPVAHAFTNGKSYNFKVPDISKFFETAQEKAESINHKEGDISSRRRQLDSKIDEIGNAAARGAASGQ